MTTTSNSHGHSSSRTDINDSIDKVLVLRVLRDGRQQRLKKSGLPNLLLL